METLPALPFAYPALEPYIDEQTMRIHHTKHHQAYIDKYNIAIKGTQFENISAEKIMCQLETLPASIQTIVRNNAGGHVNHTFFWSILSPDKQQCSGAIKQKIENTFGSYEEFIQQFTQTAMARFGSGWAWLVLDGNKLQITSTANQDSPLMEKKVPLLGLDVWEHAYYLKYQNKRQDYVTAFFQIINWKKVNELLSEAS